MVECSGLENRQARKGLESSNLSPSASITKPARKGGFFIYVERIVHR